MIDKKSADTVALAREMARSGRFKDYAAIESALALRGDGSAIDLLVELGLKSEIEALCTEACAKKQ